jgi:hypothetical protein
VDRAIRSGQYDDALVGLDALTQMGTLTQQVSGYINHFSEPAWQLANAESAAEEMGRADLAANALANWILLVSYSAWHLRLDRPHPFASAGLVTMGPAAPWTAAAALFNSDDWLRKWVNKAYLGAEILVMFLSVLRDGYSVRDDQQQFETWLSNFAGFVWVVVHGPAQEQTTDN